MNSLNKLRITVIILIVSVLGSLDLSSIAQAVVPPPDGGYPGGNTAEGQSALLSLTSGTFNTAVGLFSLLSNTEGSFNTAIGAGTLLSNTADTVDNTAIGGGALLSNTFGSSNTATGAFALFNNTEGSTNTAVGDTALFSNTTGAENTATGFLALSSNTTGSSNTATGEGALSSNTSSGNNTAVGANALRTNSTGSTNTATGSEALINNTIGSSNTAIGHTALASNTTNSLNTAVGAAALASNSGFNNIALGAGAGANLTTGDSNIDIANPGVAGESNTIRIGLEGTQTGTFIAGIRDQQVGNDLVPVQIDSFGKLGTTVSSRRFKRDIKPMGHVSEAILALKPVTFRYKSDAASTVPQFGLIAEEVAEVNPDLVVRDKNGEIYSVRYDAVNAMLLNEFLKEHKNVQELKSTAATQDATIAGLKSTVARQEARSAQQEKDFRSASAQQQKRMELLTTKLEEQAAQIQRVSAHIRISRPGLKTVLNNP